MWSSWEQGPYHAFRLGYVTRPAVWSRDVKGLFAVCEYRPETAPLSLITTPEPTEQAATAPVAFCLNTKTITITLHN